jgi:hypothetical protein
MAGYWPHCKYRLLAMSLHSTLDVSNIVVMPVQYKNNCSCQTHWMIHTLIIIYDKLGLHVSAYQAIIRAPVTKNTEKYS